RVRSRRRARPAARAARRRARPAHARALARARSRLDRSGAHRPSPDAGGRRCSRTVGLSRRRHADGRALCSPRLPPPMSYTLRGRLESRLAALVVPLAVALSLAGTLGEWWPVELCGLMAGVGLAADLLYHPALPYQ